VLEDRAGRTVGRTLSALDARGLGQINVTCRGYSGIETPFQERERPDILKYLAHLDTPSTLDALGRVENDGAGRVIFAQLADTFFEYLFPDTKVGDQALEFTIVVAPAGQTVIRVIGENQFNNGPAHLDQLRVMSDDPHPVFDRGAA